MSKENIMSESKSVDLDKAKKDIQELNNALLTLLGGTPDEIDKLELEIYRKYSKDLEPMLNQLVLFRKIGTPEEISYTIMSLTTALAHYYEYVIYLESLCDEANVFYDKDKLDKIDSKSSKVTSKSKMN